MLPLKVDDFNFERSWWFYHRDGTVAADKGAIENGRGFLKIRLKDPVNGEECNVGISDAQPLYSKHQRYLEMEARLKLLSPMKAGSRGWGFWKTARHGKADYLAWFMQQHLPGHKDFSWSRAGTISRRQAAFQPVPLEENRWHTYRVIRDLDRGETRYYVDDRPVLAAHRLAPSGRMAFHLWIDNQVYSRSRGIQRQGWQGESAMLVDYVTIRTERFLVADGQYFPVYRHLGKEQLWDIKLPAGKNALIVSATLEDLTPHDRPDRLAVAIDGPGSSGRITLTGDRERQRIQSALLKVDMTEPAEIRVRATPQSAPFLESLTTVSYDSLLYSAQNLAGTEREELIPFSSGGGEITVVVVAVTREAEGWSPFNKRKLPPAQGLRIDLNNGQYVETVDGNRQFGLSRTVIIRERLKAGTHTLRLTPRGKPDISLIWISEKKQ